ncbi:MAG: DNA mismatch repair endonuclease MutL [Bdellovibrionales bacterium]|nr:DNA mismatch repair endonuclease MutL [Bdellovibrionales bacterium]
MSARKIQLLPPEIIHRIAAGEVVDKPASILKELVENAVDAGARKLQITVVEGGLRSLQVEDDGWGMSREDLDACIQRHATSKISQLEDLEAISSLGFRGEALSAAASVSRLTIDTFREGDGAWVLQVVGGARQDVRPGTRKRGTRVLLEDLFFNVPARRKFLRKPGLEANDCVDALEALALSHPQVAFSWSIVDSRGELTAQRELRASDLGTRLEAIEGTLAERKDIQLDGLAPGVNHLDLSFFLPPASSQTQKSVRLSVNGRPITDKRLPYVLREAFAGLIEVGRFPVAQVSVVVDPTLIDVNIHPQKKEIRWSSGFNVGGLVYGIVRDALAARAKAPVAPEARAEQVELPTFAASQPSSAAGPAVETNLETTSGVSFASLVPAPAFVPSAPKAFNAATVQIVQERIKPAFRFADLRVIGEASAAWILCESAEGLIVIDQHAAHERINFEKQLARLNLLRSKPLFIPIRLKLPLSMDGSESTLTAALEKIGFEFADADTLPKGEVEIIAVPETDRRLDWDDLVEQTVAEITGAGVTDRIVANLRVRIAASLACHGSVRRGQRLGNDEIRALLQELDTIDWGGLCPHGRPVWFLMSTLQIESMFHR